MVDSLHRRVSVSPCLIFIVYCYDVKIWNRVCWWFIGVWMSSGIVEPGVECRVNIDRVTLVHAGIDIDNGECNDHRLWEAVSCISVASMEPRAKSKVSRYTLFILLECRFHVFYLVIYRSVPRPCSATHNTNGCYYHYNILKWRRCTSLT